MSPQPLRYPFTPGMRIRDLIPDRDALITPDFYRRKNLLVQVIEDEDRLRMRDEIDRDAIGATRGGHRCRYQRRARRERRRRAAHGAAPARAIDATPHERDATTRTASTATNAAQRRRRPRARRSGIRDEDRAAAKRARRTPAALFEELNWDYATIERLNPDLTHAGDPVQPRQGRAAGRRREQHRPRARRRRHRLQPEGHARSGRRARRAWSRSRARSTRPASTSCSRARR